MTSEMDVLDESLIPQKEVIERIVDEQATGGTMKQECPDVGHLKSVHCGRWNPLLFETKERNHLALFVGGTHSDEKESPCYLFFYFLNLKIEQV